jgi:DNA adenine methylase
LVPALLKWIGNKQRFAKTIVSYMPPTFNNYYEPFLGSGAVLGELLYHNAEKLYPKFEYAYANDILPFLIDIFKIVKTRPDDLIKYYQKEITAYYSDPTEHNENIRQRFNANRNAYDFCLLSRTCYSGVIRFRKSDGHMSTPRGPHKPISPETFKKRVQQWSNFIQKTDFSNLSFQDAMDQPANGDVVYCDPPYTHSQSIIYGAQEFKIDELWEKISECKHRKAHVILSLNCWRESKGKDVSVEIPPGLFERQVLINCGTSMIDRLQNSGKGMKNEEVHDKLLLTW